VLACDQRFYQIEVCAGSSGLLTPLAGNSARRRQILKGIDISRFMAKILSSRRELIAVVAIAGVVIAVVSPSLVSVVSPSLVGASPNRGSEASQTPLVGGPVQVTLELVNLTQSALRNGTWSVEYEVGLVNTSDQYSCSGWGSVDAAPLSLVTNGCYVTVAFDQSGEYGVLFNITTQSIGTFPGLLGFGFGNGCGYKGDCIEMFASPCIGQVNGCGTSTMVTGPSDDCGGFEGSCILYLDSPVQCVVTNGEVVCSTPWGPVISGIMASSQVYSSGGAPVPGASASWTFGDGSQALNGLTVTYAYPAGDVDVGNFYSISATENPI
jgi:hypothetical protein